MTENIIRIATRSSPLALWQAKYVAKQLQHYHTDLQVELITMKTKGDKILDVPLAKVGGKGLFVKELEEGMIRGDADIAVHSMKDVPVELPEGFHLACICERENPYDAMVSHRYQQLESLPEGAKVGSSSLRRQAQLRAWRPDLQLLSLRGSVNTRLAKLDNNDFDAIILATAGLLRLKMPERITATISDTICLPAIGQGAVGIECRIDDQRVNEMLQPLNHDQSAICVTAERAFNHRLEGGCQVPIAGFAQLHQQEDKTVLHFRGLVGAVDGSILLKDQITGDPKEAEQLGITVAERLLERGADNILKALYE